ncbi:hypothetical protein [Enterococcus mediterraneensis]|uniref:hypothetical protein n=1 Tax=Enterococcus mediterraneensis TaxID=2364791 RepID=UPI000F04F25B|nr:hypothetical protein [Enterococcus mediterraneensis]
MENQEQKRKWGLIGLYILLVAAACLVRQSMYHMAARIFFFVTVALIIIIWRVLYKKKIIGISFFSTALEKNLHKSERLFLYSFPTLLMPILKLKNITMPDILWSIALVILVFLLYMWDIQYLKRKVK